MRLPAIALLVPVALAIGGCGQAGKPGVQAGIEQIASISDEGALIAEGVARARTKTTFVRSHGDELSAQAGSLEQAFMRMTGDSVEYHTTAAAATADLTPAGK